MNTIHYLNAAHIYTLEANDDMAFNIYIDALEFNPEHVVVWYDIAKFFFRKYRKTRDIEFLTNAIACHKKAMEIKADNRLLQNDYIKTYFYKDVDFYAIQGISAKDADYILKIKSRTSGEMLINSFRNMQRFDCKLALIAQLGETRNIRYYDLMEFCVFNADHQSFVHSAIKRLPYYKKQIDVKSLLCRLKNKNQKEVNEPYFSMIMRDLE